jgi:hypothetical protein
MSGYKVVEVSYANGKMYKNTVVTNIGDVQSYRPDGCISTYLNSDSKFLDKMFPKFSVKTYKNGDKKVKYYQPSAQIYKSMLGDNTDKGIDLTIYDLCPDVDLWVGVGLYKDVESDYDIVFAIDTDNQLKSLTKYYKLQYPLPDGESLDKNPQEWHSMDYEKAVREIGADTNAMFKENFKLGSIKFKNNRPTLLKMYKSNFKDKNYAKRSGN